MSHVDEGVLHAYLDGALEEAYGADAGALRAHLRDCPECASRLAEAREIRTAAHRILSKADVPVTVPPFEEARARAERPAAAPGGAHAPRRAPRWVRWGWAASVVAALGVGWMLRGGGPPAPVGTPPGEPPRTPGALVSATPEERAPQAAEPQTDAAPPAAPAEVAGPPPDAGVQVAAVSPEGAGSVGVTGAEAEERADVADVREAAPAASEAVALRTAQPEQAARVEPLEADVMTDPPPRGGLRDIMRQEEVVIAADTAPVAGAGFDAARLGLVLVDAPGTGTPTPPGGAGAGDAERTRAGERPIQAQLRQRTAAAPSGRTVPAEQPRRRAAEDAARQRDAERGGSLVVPGLEVISISWVEDGALAGGVRVLQLLPAGDTLEVIHLPADVELARLEPFGDGRTGVLAARGSGWVILRARRPVAELAELKARLDGARGGN